MDDTRKRLDEAMDRRRLELRIRWVEVARRAGMSVTNLNLIRKGKIAITDLAAANLEDALELEGGSIRAVLDDPEAELRPRAGAARPQGSKRKRPPLDPLTSTPEEIAEFLEEVRQKQGDDVFFELFQATLKVNMRERERTERRTHDRTDAGRTASDNS